MEEPGSAKVKLEGLQALVTELQEAQVQLQEQLKQAIDAEAAAKAGEAAARADLKRQDKELDEVSATADALQVRCRVAQIFSQAVSVELIEFAATSNIACRSPFLSGLVGSPVPNHPEFVFRVTLRCYAGPARRWRV
jgi:hypothetical protein